MNINMPFLSNVLTMLSGTAFALAIPLLASPIISRLYTPEMFGKLGIFIAITSVCAIVATGRYELAILIPRNNITALSIAILACSSAIATSTMIFIGIIIAVYFVPEYMLQLLPSTVWMVAVPIGVLLLAALQTLTYWQSRRQAYKTIAGARAVQASGMTSAQIVISAASASGTGLISAHIFGLILCIFNLLISGWKTICQEIPRSSRRLVLSAGYRFASMPKYLAIGHLINILSTQLPVILYATLYSPAQAGIFAFAERIIIVPCAVIANSIGEVYRQASAEHFQKFGNCRKLFLRTKIQLFVLGAFFAIAVATCVIFTFTIAFGETWADVEDLYISLGIIVFFQTISSPLSQTVYLASMHRADLAWQIFRLSLIVLAIWVSEMLYSDFVFSVLLYSIALAVTYSMHSIMQWHAARGDPK